MDAAQSAEQAATAASAGADAAGVAAADSTVDADAARVATADSAAAASPAGDPAETYFTPRAVNPSEFLDEVVENFEVFLRQANFADELHLLHIGTWNFLRRRQMVLELRGLYAGLWHRALCRSLPTHADAIFDKFINRDAQRRPGRKSAQFRERANQYKDMLESTGDQNFVSVSEHLLSFSSQTVQEHKNLGLRLALCLRATYTMIFDRLI